MNWLIVNYPVEPPKYTNYVWWLTLNYCKIKIAWWILKSCGQSVQNLMENPKMSFLKTIFVIWYQIMVKIEYHCDFRVTVPRSSNHYIGERLLDCEYVTWSGILYPIEETDLTDNKLRCWTRRALARRGSSRKTEED